MYSFYLKHYRGIYFTLFVVIGILFSVLFTRAQVDTTVLPDGTVLTTQVQVSPDIPTSTKSLAGHIKINSVMNGMSDAEAFTYLYGGIQNLSNQLNKLQETCATR